MNLAPIELQHGERYGKLTVLRKVKTSRGWQYRVGCVCGFTGTILRASQLMKGKVTACLKCSSASAASRPVVTSKDSMESGVERTRTSNARLSRARPTAWITVASDDGLMSEVLGQDESEASRSSDLSLLPTLHCN